MLVPDRGEPTIKTGPLVRLEPVLIEPVEDARRRAFVLIRRHQPVKMRNECFYEGIPVKLFKILLVDVISGQEKFFVAAEYPPRLVICL